MSASVRMTPYLRFLVPLSLSSFSSQSKSDLCCRKQSDFCPLLLLNCALCLYVFFFFKLKLSKSIFLFFMLKDHFSEGYF